MLEVRYNHIQLVTSQYRKRTINNPFLQILDHQQSISYSNLGEINLGDSSLEVDLSIQFIVILFINYDDVLIVQWIIEAFCCLLLFTLDLRRIAGQMSCYVVVLISIILQFVITILLLRNEEDCSNWIYLHIRKNQYKPNYVNFERLYFDVVSCFLSTFCNCTTNLTIGSCIKRTANCPYMVELGLKIKI